MRFNSEDIFYQCGIEIASTIEVYLSFDLTKKHILHRIHLKKGRLGFKLLF
ncbi:MAG: hypothetical protein JETT_1546 [Candidatus Jettenia ecosi]|uniref:Uncharacterized protein n=1 Tax=Candidatus Jettenia ecosi TaxID=2494326 RepID=A0A533QC27_9BACT|nr:MAG: hypothetical protein JETT_1546 [Candidatus Jettenia ecosi]